MYFLQFSCVLLQTSHRSTIWILTIEYKFSLIQPTWKYVFNSLGSQLANSYPDLANRLSKYLHVNYIIIFNIWMWILKISLYCFTCCDHMHIVYHIYQSLQHLFQPVLSILKSVIFRILWKHVRVQGVSSHDTKPDFRVGLLWLLRMWTLQVAQLGGLATHLNHPQILPQAMIMFQWLLRT